MKNKKRLILIFLSLFTALSFAACGSSAQKGGREAPEALQARLNSSFQSAGVPEIKAFEKSGEDAKEYAATPAESIRISVSCDEKGKVTSFSCESTGNAEEWRDYAGAILTAYTSDPEELARAGKLMKLEATEGEDVGYSSACKVGDVKVAVSYASGKRTLTVTEQ